MLKYKSIKFDAINSMKKMFDNKAVYLKPTTNISRDILEVEFVNLKEADIKEYGYIKVLEYTGDLYRAYDDALGYIIKKKRHDIEFVIIEGVVYTLNKNFINKERNGFKIKSLEAKKDTTVYNFKNKGNKFGLFKARDITGKIIDKL